MKVLIFAHTPPPHHGQSYMIQLMIEGFGGDHRSSFPSSGAEVNRRNPHGIECYHVNAQLSSDLQDIGGFRLEKVARLLSACVDAVRCRFQHRVNTLYYVPAPANSAAVIRDWLALAILRPFFKCVIFHWHAFGLGHWAGSVAEWPAGAESPCQSPPTLFSILDCAARAVTRRLLRQSDLSIVLTEYNVNDVRIFSPKRIAIVPNGIPDQCIDSFPTVLSCRLRRLSERESAFRASTGVDDQNIANRSPTFDVLYLSHCTRTKGLFTAIEAILQANLILMQTGRGLQMRLIVAGNFQCDSERAQFIDLLGEDSRADVLATPDTRGQSLIYVGHANAEQKAALLSRCDALVFPTFFQPETFGLVLLEALSFGLPIVATTWRGISEIVPPELAELVQPDNPDQLANALLRSTKFGDFQKLRDRFLDRYTLDTMLKKLALEFTISRPADSIMENKIV